MDNNKILNDDNLNELEFIKKIDTYSIVDKEFNRKREKKKIWRSIGISTFIVLFTILILMINKILPNIITLSKNGVEKMFLKGIIGYYILSVWGVMLLIIPIMKRKRVEEN